MSAIFLLPVCLSYWPRKYITHITHVDNSHQVWSWYDHRCRVIAFLSADTLRELVTLTFDFLTLSRVTWPTLPPKLKTLRLSALKLRVITFPVGYHWKGVHGHCACTKSRDPWVGGQKQLHFWNPRPRFAYSLWHFGGPTMKIIKVICENNAQPRVKRHMSFTWFVKCTLNLLLQSFSPTWIYRTGL